MEDPDNTNAHSRLASDRQSIRDAIMAQLEERALEEDRKEYQRRLLKREQQANARRSRAKREAVYRKNQRIEELNETSKRAQERILEASYALKRALRAVFEVRVPRRTAEWRQQQKRVRAIQNAIANLRQASRGVQFDENSFETDFDIDLF